MTLLLGAAEGRVPGILYWGTRLPEDFDIAALLGAQEMPIAHASLDQHTHATIFPEYGRGDFGQAGMEAFHWDGGESHGWATQCGARMQNLTPAHLIVRAQDHQTALTLEMHLSLASETGLLSAFTVLTNDADQALVVNWLSCPVLPCLPGDIELLAWGGRWCAEFQRSQVPWRKGCFTTESRLGRTSHEHFPGLVSLGPGAGEHTGKATGFHLAHSGNWRMVAEMTHAGEKRILAGALFLPGEKILPPGGSYTTPTLFAGRSDAGLNGLAQAFHREVRKAILPPRSGPRPVHYNSWEALYFKTEPAALLDLAERAAAIGAERFVLDDGWFKGRSDDRRALGDWEADQEKLPGGLGPIIARVQQLGMSFGLWVEPEMVSEDSDLFRNHPDWVLRLEGHEPVLGRQQSVLDIARPEVRQYLFERLDHLLTRYAITYLKWDMNRPLLPAARNGRPVAQEQVSALYTLLGELRSKHPGIEIESCSSGGGRIDFAIAHHATRFWLSDNNDAHDRWRIQEEAGLFFPAEIFGHHVGPSPSHTTGRSLSMEFRAFSAAASGGHMGMELDLRRLTDAERGILAQAIAFHKKWRSILHGGIRHRLELPRPYDGHIMIAAEGTRFLTAIVQSESFPQTMPPIVALTGLLPERSYRVRFAEGAPVPRLGARAYRSPLIAGADFSGAALQQGAFRLPPGWPDQIWLIEGDFHENSRPFF
ncbi:MAG TPA: alpha-galactosidase [Dongiaceae bacterium]|nr:alpha-galactosidase [Dongiaceae bacterium]